MKYDEAYIQSKDIDWFCVIGDVYCHIASAGGVLPDQINDREKLRDIQKKVFDASDIFTENDFIFKQTKYYHDFRGLQKVMLQMRLSESFVGEPVEVVREKSEEEYFRLRIKD